MNRREPPLLPLVNTVFIGSLEQEPENHHNLKRKKKYMDCFACILSWSPTEILTDTTISLTVCVDFFFVFVCFWLLLLSLPLHLFPPSPAPLRPPSPNSLKRQECMPQDKKLTWYYKVKLNRT